MGELNFGRLVRRGLTFGDQPAIKDLGNGHEATYAEHFDRVGRLCNAIAGLGVRSSESVAVLAGASHVYVELWRACCAGAAVINPINNRLAPDELAYILGDAGSKVIFVDAAHAKVIAAIREQVPSLEQVVLIGDAVSGDVRESASIPCDHLLDDLMAAAVPDLPPEPSPDSTAVLMYTGGTTGLPKGVVISHRAITLSIYRMQSAVDVGKTGATPNYLAFMPMFHIGGVACWGLYLPLGGRSIVLPAFDPGAVNQAIRDEQITAIGAVPTMLAMMLDHPDFEPAMLESLELVMYGAAPMPPTLLARMMTLYPNLGFHQAYGMTEICAIATGLTRADHLRGGDILRSVGRPSLGIELELRDPESGAPTPRGEVGEIWLRSDSVMTEYWNKPEQTASSLVDGWYRSGDAARLDDDGYVFMADRVKDMIVSGGENVYSLEVENALSDHPQVRQVAVVGLPDDTWGERVHAVVVCDPATVTEAELDELARGRIAGFKVPKSWSLQNDPLPLSAAGKVLKRDLRDRFTAP